MLIQIASPIQAHGSRLVAAGGNQAPELVTGGISRFQTAACRPEERIGRVVRNAGLSQ